MENYVPKKYKKYFTIGNNGSPRPTVSRQTKWFRRQQENNLRPAPNQILVAVADDAPNNFNDNYDLNINPIIEENHEIKILLKQHGNTKISKYIVVQLTQIEYLLSTWFNTKYNSLDGSADPLTVDIDVSERVLDNNTIPTDENIEDNDNAQQEFLDNSDLADETTTHYFSNSKVTTEESELLLLAFALRHKLTSRALEDLIDLINSHTPDHPIHQSKYYLLKKFTEVITPLEVHYFCEKCQAILPNDRSNED